MSLLKHLGWSFSVPTNSSREALGIVVQYKVKIRLVLGFGLRYVCTSSSQLVPSPSKRGHLGDSKFWVTFADLLAILTVFAKLWRRGETGQGLRNTRIWHFYTHWASLLAWCCCCCCCYRGSLWDGVSQQQLQHKSLEGNCFYHS